MKNTNYYLHIVLIKWRPGLKYFYRETNLLTHEHQHFLDSPTEVKFLYQMRGSTIASYNTAVHLLRTNK